MDECDIFAPKSEHEKLALKIASDCEQTLMALTNEIEKDGWISVWGKSSKHVLVVLVDDYDSSIFGVGIGYTLDGQWKIASGAMPHSHITYWMPFPFPRIASKLGKGE